MFGPILGAALLAALAAGDFEPVGENAQGFAEYRRARDGAVVVLVPAGEFRKRTYTRDILDDGDPTPLEVPAFLIDKHEVTNAQVVAYLRSLDDARIGEGLIRDGAGRLLAVSHAWGLQIGPDGPTVRPGFERHPAVGITGWLALGYARWVGGDLPQGYEWEKAAAGPEGRVFPWGEERPDRTRANAWRTGPRRTLPVGSRPAGASPYGLLDMAGNVYERTYWTESPEDRKPKAMPVMLRGGSWVSPHWANLRCVDRCAQPMAAAEGSVGFRVVIRDPKAIAGLPSPAPRTALRIFDDTDAAFAEAEARNVPVFLFLAYDTCGQCDRTRAEILTDPRFVEYVNEHVVMLAGHDPGDGWKDPLEPPEGPSRLYPGCRAEKLREVFSEWVRAANGARVPEAIWAFRVSPGMFALTPHRDRVEKPEDLILVGEEQFPKSGWGVEVFIERLKAAQAKLGEGVPRSKYRASEKR